MIVAVVGDRCRPASVLKASVAAGTIIGVQVHASEEPSSMLWSDQEDRALKLRERGLLDAIASGKLDEHLVAISDAVHARRELLHTVSSAEAIAPLCVGDVVVFNRRIRPRYLEHELAVITELDERCVMVRLARPVGRFREGELRCPPLTLRRIKRSSTPAAT